MKSYYSPVSAKVFRTALGTILIALAGYMFFNSVINSQNSTFGPVLFLLLLTGLGVAIIISAFQYRIIIDTDSISIRDMFKTKTLYLSQIEGYTIETQNRSTNLVLKPNESGLPELKIDNTSDNIPEVMDWIKANCKDLDKELKIKETKEILSDETFGGTMAEREAMLKKATKVSRIAVGAGLALSAWVFIYPKPYALVCWLCIAFPLVGLFIYARFNGLIKINSQDKSVYPSVGWAMGAPILALLVRMLIDFDLLNYTPIWQAMAIIAGLVVVVFIVIEQNIKSNRENVLSLSIAVLIAALIYGYGISVFINCYFDDHAENVFAPKIVSKHISGGKHSSYYLTLEHWGPRKSEEQVSVARSLYNKVSAGGEVKVSVYKGKLGASWFEVYAE